MTGPRSEPLPPITLMSLDGDDLQAQAFAAAEWEKAADRLDRSSERTVDTVFTAHLLPDDARLPVRPDPDALRNALISVHFPYVDAGLLKEVARRETEHLFATGGARAARSLITAIDQSVLVRGLDAGKAPDSPFANAVAFASPQEEVDAARRCREACQKALQDIQEEAAAAVTSIEAIASAMAATTLGAALAEVYTEAPRYLTIPGVSGSTTAKNLLEIDFPASQVVVEGRDVAPLIGALRAIHERRRTLQRVTGELAAERARPQSSTRPAQLSLEITEAADDLALAVLVETERFPVLHRLWRRPDVPAAVTVVGTDNGSRVTTAAGSSPAAIRAAADWLAALHTDLYENLRRTARQNRAFDASLAGNPDHVWRYPPLISRALAQSRISDPSIAFRAAEDRLAEEQSMTLLQTLNLVSAGLSMAAWLTAAAPPVSLALAVTGAALGVADAVQDYLVRLESDEAFNSVLDPGKAVATEPGYLGVIVNVAFAVLDIKGVRDAYRSVRVAGLAATSTEAATAVGLVTP